MSGNNQNAYAKPSRLLLGLGDLYINNEFVGNLKDSVEFVVTRNYAYQRPGNNVADIKGEITSEEVLLTASICDIKVEQLRRAFGIDEAIVEEAKTIRKREVVQLVDDEPTAMTETILGGIRVSSLDRETLHASGVDYEMSGTDGIKRITSAGITNGAYVAVEYNFSDAQAKATLVGGETKTPNTFEVIFTHLDSDGKYWQIRLFKAMVNTDFSMALNERESGDFTMHNIGFKALVDLDKPEGQNLFEIIQEDGAA